MNILVTGAAGFIGLHLTQALAREGHRVRGLLLPREDGQALEGLEVEIFRGNLTRPESLAGVADDMDIVYHLAARTLDWGRRKQFERVTVDGTRHLLEASRGHIARFVYCSSIAALGFGRAQVGLTEDARREFCGIPYCDTKIMAEDLVAGFCRRNRIDYTIVRPANVFGPGSVWVKEILDAFRRGPFPLIARGRAPGAFVYIDNLVAGMLLAGQAASAAGRTYHFRDDYPLPGPSTSGRWAGGSAKFREGACLSGLPGTWGPCSRPC